MSHDRRRGARSLHGFTLVEAVLGLSLFLVVLGGALALWRLATRSARVSSAAEGLQTALLIEERLSLDLHRVAVPAGAPVRLWREAPGALAFYVHADDPRPDPAAIQGVKYTWDGPGTPLRRWCAGVTASVGAMPLATVSFTPISSATGPLLRVSLGVARPANEGAAPPVIHTFLARLPSLSSRAPVRWRFVSDLPTPEDVPRDPDIAGP